MTAQAATSGEIANSTLRRLQTGRKTLGCAEVQVGDSAGFSKRGGRKSAPKRRGPAAVLCIGGRESPRGFRAKRFKWPVFERGSVKIRRAWWVRTVI